MSFTNNVKTTLNTAIDSSISTIILNVATAPFNNPPLSGGRVMLTDSLVNPANFEIITYSRAQVSGGTITLYECARGLENTTGVSWVSGSTAFMSLTAEQAAGFARSAHIIDFNGGNSSTVYWDSTINCGASI